MRDFTFEGSNFPDRGKLERGLTKNVKAESEGRVNYRAITLDMESLVKDMQIIMYILALLSYIHFYITTE